MRRIFDKPLPYSVYFYATNSSGKSTVSGWSYCIVRDGLVVKQKNGFDKDCSMNRACLHAALEAIRAARQLPGVVFFEETWNFFSDNEYVIRCYFEEWYKKWQKNGWMTIYSTPIANQDLWAYLIPFFTKMNVSFGFIPDNTIWKDTVIQLALQGQNQGIKLLSKEETDG